MSTKNSLTQSPHNPQGNTFTEQFRRAFLRTYAIQPRTRIRVQRRNPAAAIRAALLRILGGRYGR